VIECAKVIDVGKVKQFVSQVKQFVVYVKISQADNVRRVGFSRCAAGLAMSAE
jgi:hypothetical protein